MWEGFLQYVYNSWHVTHSKNHWSTEKTMVKYIDNVIILYISANRESNDQSALVTMDNFKGQITPSVVSLLEDNNILVCYIPPNTTDKLQPLDISVNKLAKDFLKQKFQEWYSVQILQQLDLSATNQELQPIDLCLPVLRKLGAKWLVEMAQYVGNNPDFIVKGFLRAGISRALDDTESDDEDCNSVGDGSSEASSNEETSDEEALHNSDDMDDAFVTDSVTVIKTTSLINFFKISNSVIILNIVQV